MKWLGLVLLLIILAGSGGAALLAPDWSGPGMVSGADLVTGGGIGVERAGRNVAFGSHGQRLEVYRPTRAGNKARPVLIFFHGGAWRDGSRAAYAFAGRALARLGFVVIVPDYRKVPGNRFPDFMIDAAQALAWAQANSATYGGDPARIGVIGHSSGAHIALLLTLDPRWAASAHLPRDVIKAAVGISGPYDFYPFDEAASRDAFAGSPPRETQPITFARADAPPVLLIASRADRRVKVRNSMALTDRLIARGAHPQLMLVDGLSHETTLLALLPQLRWLGPVRERTGGFLAQTLAPLKTP